MLCNDFLDRELTLREGSRRTAHGQPPGFVVEQALNLVGEVRRVARPAQ
jgi:hypothetical protein